MDEAKLDYSYFLFCFKRDLRSLDPHWVRGTLIGFINQEPILFATSVMENIRYGKPSATDEQVLIVMYSN